MYKKKTKKKTLDHFDCPKNHNCNNNGKCEKKKKAKRIPQCNRLNFLIISGGVDSFPSNSFSSCIVLINICCNSSSFVSPVLPVTFACLSLGNDVVTLLEPTTELDNKQEIIKYKQKKKSNTKLKKE